MKGATPAAVLALVALCCAATGLGFAAQSGKSIQLPPPQSTFRDGPNVALAQQYCLTCHSSDYVYTQPPLTRATWQAEVTKMRVAYGAPIPDSAVGPLVDYLVSQNGQP
jgi:hypothetical protein